MRRALLIPLDLTAWACLYTLLLVSAVAGRVAR